MNNSILAADNEGTGTEFLWGFLMGLLLGVFMLLMVRVLTMVFSLWVSVLTNSLTLDRLVVLLFPCCSCWTGPFLASRKWVCCSA